MDALLLAEMTQAYLRRTGWEARVRAVEVVKALMAAMGGQGGRGGGRTSADGLMAAMGAGWG